MSNNVMHSGTVQRDSSMRDAVCDLLAHRTPPRPPLTVELQVRLKVETLNTDITTESHPAAMIIK